MHLVMITQRLLLNPDARECKVSLNSEIRHYTAYIIDLKADSVTFNWGARRKSVAQRYPLVLQWIVVLQKQEEDGEDADYQPQIWTF